MKFRRLLGRIGVGFGVLIAGLVLATGAREKRKFALLAVDIHASRDPRGDRTRPLPGDGARALR